MGACRDRRPAILEWVTPIRVAEPETLRSPRTKHPVVDVSSNPALQQTEDSHYSLWADAIVEITVFNRGIALFTSDDERICRIHRVLCRLQRAAEDRWRG